MTTEIGSITLDRSLREHWVWSKPFSPAQAWIDMLLEANWDAGKIDFNGRNFKLGRGQFVTSKRELGRRWGWTYSKVVRFLTRLEKDEMIAQKSFSHADQITIRNYNKRQRKRITPGSTMNQHSDQTSAGNNSKSKKSRINNESMAVTKSPKNKKPILLYNSNKQIPPIPPFVKYETWVAFVDHRKEIKKPLSENAADLAIKKLTKFYNNGHDPNEIMEDSIVGGYQGLFEPKQNGRKQVKHVTEDTRCVVCGKRGRFARENKWYCSDKCHTGVSDSSKVNSIVSGIGKNL